MTAREAELLPFGSPTKTYTMRAYDTTLAQYVYWFTASLDAAGIYYDGPGPLTDIVVFTRKGS
jgi:hypothetical protein